MTPGIYHVKFKSAQQGYGEGLAVFKDGTVNGGDVGYLYTGSFQNESGTVSSTLKIKKWNPSVQSVFGNIPEFTLELKGSFSPDYSSFEVNGGVSQMPGLTITISGKRLADAV